MEHNDIRDILSEYIDGSITAQEMTEIEAHLKTCQPCSNALHELQKTIEHIKAVGEIEPPAWMTQKIMVNVRTETEKKKGRFERFFLPFLIKLPIQAVAVVFLAVTAIYIYRSIQPAPAPSEAPTQELASGKEAPKDTLARADDHAPRATQVPQSPAYKSLDMKLEYEEPALPKPMDKAEVPAPAPAKTDEEPIYAKEEMAEGKVAAPQAGAPRMVTEEAAQSAGLSASGDLKAFAPVRKSKSSAMADGTSNCFVYEPTVVAVSGSMNKFYFPGRPNYESIGQGDERETYWVLKLHNPICVANDRNDTVNVSESAITDIQLVLNADMYQKYRPLLKKQVIVKGTLFHAHTGHHHTPVLLQVLEIRPTKK